MELYRGLLGRQTLQQKCFKFPNQRVLWTNHFKASKKSITGVLGGFTYEGAFSQETFGESS